MKVFLTTVAGTATRFSESVGKPTLKCIYHGSDPTKTLLYRMISFARDFERVVIVGGFLFEELEAYVDGMFPRAVRDKVVLVRNDKFEEYGSGWSLYRGLSEAVRDISSRCGMEEVLFAEGDLFIGNQDFHRVATSGHDVITYHHEPIKADKAVALYFDASNVPHYIYDAGHRQLAIGEPFSAIYNSGQIWKFRDVDELFRAVDGIPETGHRGTNLVLVNEYFQRMSKFGRTIDMVPLHTWINCNTVSDYKKTGLGGMGEND